MIGLFTRLLARTAIHETDPDEKRTTLADIEALLREIAATPAERGDWTDGDPSHANGVNPAYDHAQAGVLIWASK